MADKELGKAIELIEAGNVIEGREILISLLEHNQLNEVAWAWLHVCVTSDHEKIYCLKRVLELNPKNEGAKVELAKLTSKPYIKPKKDVVEKVKPKLGRKSKPVPIKQKSKPKLIKPPKFAKPHIIVNKAGENLFTEDERRTTDGLPGGDSGMYGYRLIIGDIVITPFDYPDCIEAGHIYKKSKCYFCDFFSFDDCPFRGDQDVLLDTRILFSQTKRFWIISDERRQSVMEAVYTELKEHGRALHYEILAKIIKDRYPRLWLNPLKILYLMERYPEKFECVDRGVYKAK